MTPKQKDEILDGILSWYSQSEDAVDYYDYILQYTDMGKDEWDRVVETFNAQQRAKWKKILLYLERRLENLGVTKEGSANFVRELLKQRGLWKNTLEDKLEEHLLEKMLDDVSALLKKPVAKLSEQEEDYILKHAKDEDIIQ